MTITTRPTTTGPSLLGGSIELPPNPCLHDKPTFVSPWVGAPGTVGTVAVVGAGKMGLPLAAQFASHGWRVVAVDVQEAVVAAINEGRSHLGEEPGLATLVADAHRAGRLRATTDGAAAARDADVVVLIVPVMLDDELQPDYRHMDAAVASTAPGLHAGSTVIFETTLPAGDTRGRYGPRLEDATGLPLDDELFVAFSPERLFSGATLRNLATYPKLVGGLAPASTARAAAFYDSVLDAEIVAMSTAEAAELSKLADTTYRDVNIALANELARYADRAGVDIQEVIGAANSQPYSHIHQPGLGVGGHCIPVYPQFLVARAPELELVPTARRINDGQVGVAIRAIQRILGGLEGVPILVLGLTYRDGVKELAYSRALPLIDRLSFHGAVVSAWDPLLDAAETVRCCATPWSWGEAAPFRAIVTQTADARFRDLDFRLFPELELLFDGRNSLRGVELPPGVTYQGVGVPVRAPRAEASAIR
ncbi:MAG TPA: nucleotide sugar dehydrogenase [Candidatus Limnocylindrales bacterium]|nr:nucleotide sugar dehydrogenase [Candidatus Limnocylindrales bacterium]